MPKPSPFDAPKLPTGLKRAEEVAPLVYLTPARLLELAEGGFVPHWRVDGGEVLFRTTDVRDWCARNLVDRTDGRPLPVKINVIVAGEPAADAPACIRNIPDLRPISMTGLPSGIYFLVKNGEVVYVGQSVNPGFRIATHMADDRKDFDSAFLVPVPASRLNDVEGAMIRLLRPRLNGGKRAGTPGQYWTAPGMSANDPAAVEEFCRGVEPGEGI